LAAQGRNGPTNVLPVGHEQIIKVDPILARKLFAERLLGLVRVSSLHIPQSIADPMHVDVHTDARLLIADRDD
jgi:hypothetical protein